MLFLPPFPVCHLFSFLFESFSFLTFSFCIILHWGIAFQQLGSIAKFEIYIFFKPVVSETRSAPSLLFPKFWLLLPIAPAALCTVIFPAARVVLFPPPAPGLETWAASCRPASRYSRHNTLTGRLSLLLSFCQVQTPTTPSFCSVGPTTPPAPPCYHPSFRLPIPSSSTFSPSSLR